MTALEQLKAQANAVCACDGVSAATKAKWQTLVLHATWQGSDAKKVLDDLMGW